MAAASGNSSPNPNPTNTGAESSPDGTNQTTDRSRIVYFCHQCNRDVDGVGEDFTCPRCQSGFLEEVTRDVSPGVRRRNSSGSVHSHEESNSPVDFEDFFRHIAVPMLSDLLNRQHQAPGQQNPQQRTGVQNLYGQQQQTSADNTGGSSSGGNSAAAAGSTQTAGGQQQQPQVPFQGFLQQLFEGLTNNGVFQVQFQVDNGEGGRQAFAFPMPLHGSPGDYAWGPGGLDAIVTQLLNQVEGGSPPMAAEKIDKLPEMVITKEQTEKRIQCAVCMDDFKVNEKVKQLQCEHLFHNDCIKPWLERHNSCPVCRKSADGGAGGRDDSSLGGGTGGGSRQQQPPTSQQSSSSRPRWLDIEDLD